jgi:hypothetical protein
MLYPGDAQLMTTMARRGGQTGVLPVSRELPHLPLPPFFDETVGDPARLRRSAFVSTSPRSELL